MFGSRSIKLSSVVVLIFFVVFITGADFALAQEEKSIDHTETVSHQETSPDLRGDGDGIAEKGYANKSENVIEQPAPTPHKKKKKFPVLLAIGGAVLLGVVLILVLGKKSDSDDNEEPVYDIRGDWTITPDYYNAFYITFNGTKASGTFTDSEDLTGTYTVSGYKVDFDYDTLDLQFTGLFTSENYVSGSYLLGEEINGQWVGHRGIDSPTSKNASSIKKAAGQ